MKKSYALIGWLLCLAVSGMAQSSRVSTDDHIPGQILLRLKPEVPPAAFERNFNSSGRSGSTLRHARALGSRFNMHLFTFDPSVETGQTMLDRAKGHSMVMAAQWNYTIKPRVEPNDPGFSQQWTIDRIAAPRVWDVTTGGLTARGDTIVLAILDSGFDIDHEDLKDNVWINRFEIPGNGLDDDNNDFVDDVAGWNFIQNSAIHVPDAHGTSVAGIAGAKGDNNKGMAGVNWNVKLMLLATGNVGSVIEAYEYLIVQRDRYNRTNGATGAFVVATNASFGQEQKFCNEQPLWGAMYDLMGDVGILTGAGTANSAWDVDDVGDMPTTCPSNFIITTLNMAENDRRYQGSAYGKISIDLGTPGDGAHTTKVGNEYGSFGGNSAAAPHLSGVIALLYSLPCAGLAEDALARPAEAALYIRQALLEGVDPLPSLADETATGGRLNVFRAMEIIQESCGNTTGPLALTKAYPNPVSSDLTLEYEAPDFEAVDLRVFNALGQLVFSDDILPARFGPKVYQVDVRDWATGVYFFTLYHGKELIVKTIAVF
ncbi:MAG: S8 family serine peptidase [Saprospiraceae bacterium]|nr:S8 family serine peptidase [Saprospiraceae bacterium]